MDLIDRVYQAKDFVVGTVCYYVGDLIRPSTKELDLSRPPPELRVIQGGRSKPLYLNSILDEKREPDEELRDIIA